MFHYQYHLNLHVRRRHDPPEELQEQFDCSRCNKTYKYKSSLSKHLKYECGVEKQFRCTLCSYSGKQKAHLISHMRNPALVVNGVNAMWKQLQSFCSISGAYRCAQCSRTYKNKCTLRRHQKYECGKVPQFQCQVCGRLFHQKSNWNIHLKGRFIISVVQMFKKSSIAGPPVRCPNCGKDYKNKHSLYCHLRFDCGKPNNHGCTLCSYSTKRIHSLKRHMLLRHTQNGT
ncbi:hypothetical protein HUJ04_008513 [Dendroctonus ponderosae]|nr:hypothetical protein HUJ04_008513 [Dendroctonus ponderosae]